MPKNKSKIHNLSRILSFIRNGSWSYECLEGKLDIYDDGKGITLDLYKLDESMLEKLLVSDNYNN